MRVVTSIFLALLLSLLFIDALPVTNLFHQELRRLLDPALDKLGIWQGSWALFASNPDRTNVRVSWVCTFSDGSEMYSESPHWEDFRIADRIRYFRFMEYFDSMRLDQNAPVWRDFARFVARNCEEPGKQVQKVSLTRHWAVVPQLDSKQIESQQLAARPYTRYDGSYEFYQEYFLSRPAVQVQPQM